MRADVFAAALRDPARAAPDGFGGVEAERRFAVYRNNVAASLVDALAATYPAVQALTGETFFRAAARAFALAAPPRSPVLIDWGGGFADFLAGFPPARGVPYLADVARLEWAWTRAYHAAEAAPAPLALLAERAPEALTQARLVPHPSLRLVASRFPIVSIWAETTGRAADLAPDMRRGETALVLRPDAAVNVAAIPPGDAAFLSALAAGAAVGAASEAAAQAHPGFDLAAVFLRLFQAGAFTGYAQRPPESAAPQLSTAEEPTP